MNLADSYYRVWRKITIEFGGTFTEFGGKFLPSLAKIPPKKCKIQICQYVKERVCSASRTLCVAKRRCYVVCTFGALC